MLPHLSATVRLVVLTFSVSGLALGFAVGPPHFPSYDDTLPGSTGLVSAFVGLIWQARSAANLSESRAFCGTLTYAGSPTYFPRSANASALASR